MMEELSFDQILTEIFENNSSLTGVLRCFLLNENFEFIHDYHAELNSGGKYLSGVSSSSKMEMIESRDFELCKNISDAFDNGKKMEVYFGEQEFYTSKIFEGQFSLCVVYVKCNDSCIWSLGFVSSSGFSNDALLVEIGRQLKDSVKSIYRVLEERKKLIEV